MPEISPDQAAALRALDWLFSEATEVRRSGRTYILAVAYLRRAVRTGRWVDPEDHHDAGGRRDSDLNLLRAIQQLASDAGIALDIDGRRQFRVARISAQAERWLFEEFTVPPIPPPNYRPPSPPEPEKPPPPNLWERLGGDDVV